MSLGEEGEYVTDKHRFPPPVSPVEEQSPPLVIGQPASNLVVLGYPLERTSYEVRVSVSKPLFAIGYRNVYPLLENGSMIDKITTYDEYLESDEMARKRTVYTANKEDDEN